MQLQLSVVLLLPAVLEAFSRGGETADDGVGSVGREVLLRSPGGVLEVLETSLLLV